MSAKNKSFQLYYFDQRFAADQIKPIESLIPCDRAYLFGDGFFTTALVENGQIAHIEWHQKRLTFSAEKLYFHDLPIKNIVKTITNQIKKVDRASIRITISRGQKKRGYAIDQGSVEYHVVVQVNDLIEPNKEACQLFYAKTPLSVNPALAGIKHLNRLDNVLAASEIEQPNQEALMSVDEQLICGSRSNLFILQNGTWLTPRLNKTGINGVTRQRIIYLMEQHQVAYQESIVTRSMLESSQAAFVCNSLLGIWPVSQLSQQLGNDQTKVYQFEPTACIDLIKQIKFCR